MKKAKCKIVGIVSHHLCKTTTTTKNTKEYIIIYACKSINYLWKGKQDTNQPLWRALKKLPKYQMDTNHPHSKSGVVTITYSSVFTQGKKSLRLFPRTQEQIHPSNSYASLSSLGSTVTMATENSTKDSWAMQRPELNGEVKKNTYIL